MSEKENKGGIQVISRAASILRVLKESQSGMSLGKIAERVDLPRSTVQRITSALAEEKLVIADANGGGLRLGPELSALAGAAQYSIVEHCRLLLTELTQKTGETTDLAVMRGIGMVFLDQVPGVYRLTTVSQVGEVFPLTTTANGKACLARLSNQEVIKLVQNEWDRNGIQRSLDEFLSEIDAVRKQGLAYDLDEHSVGVSAIGFSFFDWVGDLHAISVPVPSTRFPRQRDTIEQALLETASNIHQTFQ
ncbi:MULTISPECIES: IclR family transcriptional regulator [unclassified Ruegeria]|uniref:IclR family transcriptional regulator n=1 Tax=unclassified Ruegeria TaxID=2625375 RepID=UPI001489B5F7|nr:MULTISPECIES: IclR family transcriptional regulator [unclassified Ruegeria]NOD75896.1 helix-turn-helix domain-containing protein [Ruegeria sp. HKCCD4332]NOD88806.1 helix-turn-helix domain-containing protein [Ruegeria sp. HKCCD4318]NOE16201.1 helix-turn-helix domain-containing protein [Ruegeria sp. HKCCD4318-2]NOG09871.1 IclR family transcriptional regulator [Ruegeria sp. HKCCD4315]